MVLLQGVRHITPATGAGRKASPAPAGRKLLALVMGHFVSLQALCFPYVVILISAEDSHNEVILNELIVIPLIKYDY